MTKIITAAVAARSANYPLSQIERRSTSNLMDGAQRADSVLLPFCYKRQIVVVNNNIRIDLVDRPLLFSSGIVPRYLPKLNFVLNPFRYFFICNVRLPEF